MMNIPVKIVLRPIKCSCVIFSSKKIIEARVPSVNTSVICKGYTIDIRMVAKI